MYSVIGLLYIFIIVTVGLFVCKNKLVVNYNKVLNTNNQIVETK